MQLQGKWDKIGAGVVDVIVHGFSVASQDDRNLRPVAIVEEISTGNLRFVDLSYVNITRKDQT